MKESWKNAEILQETAKGDAERYEFIFYVWEKIEFEDWLAENFPKTEAKYEALIRANKFSNV